MKKLILICLLIVSAFAANAQNADDIAIAAKVENLNNAIFANKDITALETLLAKEITYGHSGGKVENRAEMIKGVMDDTKTYSDVKTEVGSILFSGKSVVVRHIISATQKEKDGKVSPLKLQVLQVWVKEKKAWKLWARQAVKLTA